MLNAEVQNALKAEMERLQIRRRKLTQKIDDRIAAIEAVLQPDEEDVAVSQLRLDSHATVRDAPVRGDLHDVGLRDAIRRVLADNPGIGVADIGRAMQRRGYQHSGKTPLNIRISNDVRRLAEVGEVERSGKTYSLKKRAEGPVAR